MAHCFNVNFVGGAADNHCHALSQSQRIDWLTLEVDPGLEAKWDRLTIDYTRTMRSFTQDDQVVAAPYNHFGVFGGGGNTMTVYPYALVPNSMFQMDRLKFGVDLTSSTRFYAYLYDGDMEDLTRFTHNGFIGFDLHLIKTLPSGITVTGYAKLNDTHNQLPPYLIAEERADPSGIWHPINYNRFWAGVDSQWFPFRYASSRWRGLSLRAAYEYHEISRSFAYFPTQVDPTYAQPPTAYNDIARGDFFVQPTTRSQEAIFESRMRWNSGVITFVDYRYIFTENPMYGLTPLSRALNSNLPTEENRITIGGSWSPLSNLLLSVRAEAQSLLHISNVANFAENNYPVLCTVWYAPRRRPPSRRATAITPTG